MEWWENRPAGSEDVPMPGDRLMITVGGGEKLEVEFCPYLPAAAVGVKMAWRMIQPGIPDICRDGVVVYEDGVYFTPDKPKQAKGTWYPYAGCQQDESLVELKREAGKPCSKCPYV